MNRTLALILLPFACSVLAAEQLVFESTDGVTVYSDLYRAEADQAAPVILLFHQARGDGRGEYGPIIGRLSERGYHVLAVDQRSGGDLFGNVNRTVANLRDRDVSYCDVYPDLEASLRKMRALGFDGPAVAWGSSYSAALVFQLAAKNRGDVAAVLAFSPASGGPLADCAPKLFSKDLDIPILVLRPLKELEVPSVPPQMERFRAEGHTTFVADPGVHGSSMLVEDRVGGSTETTWSVVLSFIEEALQQ